MRTHRGSAGQHISQAAKECVEMVSVGVGHAVELEFNDVKIVVRRGMTDGDVVAEFNRICDERRTAYLASPEYAESKRRAEEAKQKKDVALAAALRGAPTEPTMRDAAEWARQVEMNSKDDYSRGVMTFAGRWARIMEGAVAKGQTVAACAQAACSLGDVEGITGFMYGCAVSILARCWIHGEELRRWHNIDTQIGTEGEKANESGGVLNPAILNLGGA